MRVAAPVGASERMLARIVPRGPRRDRRPGVGPFCEGAPAEYDSGCDSAEYDGEDERPGAAGSRLLRLAQSTEGIAHGHRLVRPGRSGLRRRRHGRRTDASFVPDRSQRSEVSTHAEAFVRESLTPARARNAGTQPRRMCRQRRAGQSLRIVSTRSRCSAARTRAARDSGSSPARTGTRAWARIGPTSRSRVTSWTVTPVSRSPAARTAR